MRHLLVACALLCSLASSVVQASAAAALKKCPFDLKMAVAVSGRLNSIETMVDQAPSVLSKMMVFNDVFSPNMGKDYVLTGYFKLCIFYFTQNLSTLDQRVINPLLIFEWTRKCIDYGVAPQNMLMLLNSTWVCG